MIGGHQWIYRDLIGRLANADIAASSQHLGLALNDAGEAEVPFLGTTYLVSREGEAVGRQKVSGCHRKYIDPLCSERKSQPAEWTICNACGTCGAFVQTWQLFQ